MAKSTGKKFDFEIGFSEEPKAHSKKAREIHFDFTIDLTGERCPDTFVYTRIKIDELLAEGNEGNVVKAVYDSEESQSNVYNTLTGEGLFVVKEPPQDGRWVLYITLK